MEGTNFTKEQLSSICDSVISVADTYNVYRGRLAPIGAVESWQPPVIKDIHALFGTLEAFEGEVKQCNGHFVDAEENDKIDVIDSLWACYNISQDLNRIFHGQVNSTIESAIEGHRKQLRHHKADIDIFIRAFGLSRRKVPLDPTESPLSFNDAITVAPETIEPHRPYCDCFKCIPSSPASHRKSPKHILRQFHAPVQRTALGHGRDGTWHKSDRTPRKESLRRTALGHRSPARQTPTGSPDFGDVVDAGKIQRLEARIAELATSNHDLRAAQRRERNEFNSTVSALKSRSDINATYLQNVEYAVKNLEGRLPPGLIKGSRRHRGTSPTNSRHGGSFSDESDGPFGTTSQVYSLNANQNQYDADSKAPVEDLNLSIRVSTMLEALSSTEKHIANLQAHCFETENLIAQLRREQQEKSMLQKRPARRPKQPRSPFDEYRREQFKFESDYESDTEFPAQPQSRPRSRDSRHRPSDPGPPPSPRIYPTPSQRPSLGINTSSSFLSPPSPHPYASTPKHRRHRTSASGHTSAIESDTNRPTPSPSRSPRMDAKPMQLSNRETRGYRSSSESEFSLRRSKSKGGRRGDYYS